MDDIKEIYLAADEEIEGVMDDKITTLSEMFTFLSQVIFSFGITMESLDLLNSIYSYYTSMLLESDREHDIYLAIKTFLKDADDNEIEEIMNDKRCLNQLRNIIYTVDEITCKRVERHAEIYNFYKKLIEGCSLEDKKYRFIKHQEILTDTKKKVYYHL